MCELFAMSSSRPSTADFSIHEFARHGGLSGNARDGWDVAFYAGKDVRLTREAEAAADSASLRFIADHGFCSTQVIAHVRRATQGGRSLANTQPFARELGGRMHVFAHNGDLHEISKHHSLSPGRFRPIGETDSEHAFCILLRRLEPLWLAAGNGAPPLEIRFAVVRSFAKEIRRLGSANFLYSDSDALFVHGHKRRSSEGWARGLHMLRRDCPIRPATNKTGGVSITHADDEQHVVILASVPLSDEAWTPVQTGECIAVRQGQVMARMDD